MFKPHHAPVVRGISRFAAAESYTESFGFQWKRFARTQLDSYTGQSISRMRLERCLGVYFKNLRGKKVLELGCGAGRFTEILLEQNAEVYSVDLSQAIEVNAELFPPSQTHTVIQADLNDLPFKPEQFDIVMCLGVLQHTPNPEAAIAKLFTHVKPGGALGIDHYRFTLSYVSLRLLYRQIFKRLPRKLALQTLHILAPVILPLHKCFAGSKILSVVLNRFSPFVTYYSAFPEFSDEMQREWALLDSFDSLTDHYKHFRNLRQIKKCLIDLGARIVRVANDGNGVEALAVKPTAH